MEQPTEGGKRSKWMTHVKKTMKANKGKSLSQVLKLAAKTYKKSGGASLSPADYSSAGTAPTTGGRRRRGRSTRRSRKH
jgi:hypothetical protein